MQLMSTSEPKPKRATLKEVAHHAQVSQSAASTVLSGRINGIRVNPSTEARIWEAADAVGYRGRKTRAAPAGVKSFAEPARSFGRRQAVERGRLSPGIIARCTPMNEGGSLDPWDYEVPAAFERAIGQDFAVTSHYYNRWRFAEPNIPMEVAVRSLMNDGANALLVVDFDLLEVVFDYLPVLEGCGLPFVVVSSGPLFAPVANVCYDSRTAGYQAALHLIERGHRRITFFAPEEADWVDVRLDGIRVALRQAGLPADSLTLFPQERSPVVPNQPWGHVEARSYEAALTGFRQGTLAPAVIAENDQAALGIARAAEQAGRALWKDLALIGFDDVPAARFRGISTLRAPRTEMGIEAAHLLLRQWEGKRVTDLICLRSDVMPRASTSERPARV